MMRFKRLTSTDDQFYKEAMKLYSESFPLHEQRLPASQHCKLSHPEYHFNLIFDDDRFVGLMLCWETDAFLYIEHFCIFPELRNNNYGRRALELISQRGKTVILEIDPPVDNISVRRKGFYERAGFVLNSYHHVHPPYHEGLPGHNLVVMSYPSILDEDEYNSFNKYLVDTVMS